MLQHCARPKACATSVLVLTGNILEENTVFFLKRMYNEKQTEEEEACVVKTNGAFRKY